MALSRLIARPLLSAGFVLGGVNALRTAPEHATKATPLADKVVPLARRSGVPVPQDTLTLVRINAGVQIVAGLALATGRTPRLASAALAASLVPTTIVGHPFWSAKEPGERNRQLLQFAKNASMLGGVLVAAGDTEGKPGVAWRTRRAAKDARREAAHLAKSARREAKLVKAKAT